MENATKALIIAAAVLVAIIIISLTLGVVRQGQETISSADMSQAEMDAYNAKFTMHEGNNVTTAEVNALLNVVNMNNQNVLHNNAKGNAIPVMLDGIVINTPTEKIITKVTGSNRYTVKCVFSRGLVIMVEVKTNP